MRRVADRASLTSPAACLFPPFFFFFVFLLSRASILYYYTNQQGWMCWHGPDVFKRSALTYILSSVLCYRSGGGRHCLSRNCKYICEFRAVAVDVVDDRRLEFLQTTSKEDWEGAQRLFVGVLIDQHTHLLWWNTSSRYFKPNQRIGCISGDSTPFERHF